MTLYDFLKTALKAGFLYFSNQNSKGREIALLMNKETGNIRGSRVGVNIDDDF